MNISTYGNIVTAKSEVINNGLYPELKITMESSTGDKYIVQLVIDSELSKIAVENIGELVRPISK
jgi:hypothetical protein